MARVRECDESERIGLATTNVICVCSAVYLSPGHGITSHNRNQPLRCRLPRRKGVWIGKWRAAADVR